MSISSAEYATMLARLQSGRGLASMDRERANAVRREADLHEAIIDFCESKGWLYFHGAMCRRTSRTMGEPDFIIFREGGCLLIECKARDGKETPEQLAVAAHARHLGHRIYVVRSMAQFLEVVGA